MSEVPDKDVSRLGRLTDAIEAFLEHEAGPGDGEFLERHAGLRDLLEPMLEEGPAPVGDAERYLGEYRLVRELGRGGMGVVFEAVHVPLGRRVALKILPAHLTLSPRQIERFRGEAAAIARLSHPGIVPVYDVGEVEKTHYFAMELVDGRNLADALAAADAGGLGVVRDTSFVAEAVEITARVAEALQYAHDHGVLHRDVKPHNILIGRDGSVRLVDFGLARDEARHSVSQTGDFAGTPHYASPEQIAGARDIDGRADVFSLGVVLYELLARSRPFHGQSTEQLLEDIRSREPRALRRQNTRVPRDLEVICHKALEKDPAHRYQTAGELATDLRRFLRLEPIVAQPPGPLSRISKIVRRNRLLSVVVALLAVLAVGTPGILWVNAARLQQKDAEHLAHTRRLLREAVELLAAARLESRPKSETIYLDQLRRIAALHDELLAREPGDAQLRFESTVVLARLAQAHQALGDFAAAAAAQDRVVSVLGELLAASPRDVRFQQELAAARRDRSAILRTLSRRDEAVADLDAAIAMLESLPADALGGQRTVRQQELLARSLATRGEILFADGGDSAAAEQAFERSLAHWARAGGDDPAHARGRALTLLGRADMLTRTGRLARALPDVEAAHEVLRQQLAAQPDDPVLRHAMTDCLRHLINVHLAMGADEAALQRTREALAIYQSLARDFPDTLSCVQNLAFAQVQLGAMLAGEAGTQAEAWQQLEAARPIVQRLLAESPDLYSNLRLRAKLQHLEAKLLRDRPQATLAERIAAFRAAADQLRDLTVRKPEASQTHCELGDALHSLGQLQLRDGRVDEARAALEEAVRAETRAHAGNPRDDHHRLSLRRFEQQLMRACFAQADHAAVAALLRKNVPLDEAEANELAGSAQLLAKLVPLAEEDADLPEAARRAAADRYVAEVATRLERAAGKGFRVSDLAASPEFAGLQDRPALRKLFEQAR